MILAGDLGGTKTQLGLFADNGTARPDQREVREYATLDFPNLAALVSTFLDAVGVQPRDITACSIGVAGPIVNQAATLTNVPWRIDARELTAQTGMRGTWLLNDLVAMAYGVSVLRGDELHVLQAGEPNPSGSACLIAAGTGLGQAVLVRHGNGILPSPSEGGHADFGPRTEEEIALARFLIAHHGRASYEHILSGRGFVNLLRFVSGDTSPVLAGDIHDEELPARISQAGLDGTDPQCEKVVDLFVSVYGSAAANLALQCVATGGVFLGGGIAPKILSAFDRPTFLDAFRSKPPMTRLLERMPVSVVLNRQTGLLGAAAHAATVLAS